MNNTAKNNNINTDKKQGIRGYLLKIITKNPDYTFELEKAISEAIATENVLKTAFGTIHSGTKKIGDKEVVLIESELEKEQSLRLINSIIKILPNNYISLLSAVALNNTLAEKTQNNNNVNNDEYNISNNQKLQLGMTVHVIKGPFGNVNGKIIKCNGTKTWFKVLIKMFSATKTVLIHKNELIAQN